MPSSAPPPSRRLLGLDLLRFLSFVAIFGFHAEWAFYYDTGVPLHDAYWLWGPFETYAYAMSFSGFTILAMTCLLLGLRGFRRARLFAFLLGGWAVFNALIASDTDFFWVWDVYPLLALGLGVATTLERRAGRPALYALGVAGSLLLFVRFWEWDSLRALPLFWRQMVVGDCQPDSDMADWPILPWVGLVWAAYAAGRWLQARLADANGWALARTRVRLPEGMAWGMLLISSLPRWGAFFNIRIGEGFACDVYRMPPPVFWSHFLWPAFGMRVSFDDRVQAWLERRRVARWVGGLAISRHFWIAYFSSYVLMQSLSFAGRDFWLARPHASEAAFFGGFIATEFITRGLASLERQRARGGKPRAR